MTGTSRHSISVGCLHWTVLRFGLVTLIQLQPLSWRAGWEDIRLIPSVIGLLLRTLFEGFGPGTLVPTLMSGVMVAQFGMRFLGSLVAVLVFLRCLLGLVGSSFLGPSGFTPS